MEQLVLPDLGVGVRSEGSDPGGWCQWAGRTLRSVGSHRWTVWCFNPGSRWFNSVITESVHWASASPSVNENKPLPRRGAVRMVAVCTVFSERGVAGPSAPPWPSGAGGLCEWGTPSGPPPRAGGGVKEACAPG